MVNRRYRKDIPPCVGKRHQWKKGQEKTHDSGVCAVCGYDQFEDSYREV